MVGLDPTTAGIRIAVLGEAKAGRAGDGELQRLRHVRALLIERGHADSGTRLVLAGLEGVGRRLAAPDVVLADAADLVQ